MLTFKAVAEFKRQVGNTHWDINYSEFCRRAGFKEDNYSEGKWHEWRDLAKSLAAFDDDTLSRILNAVREESLSEQDARVNEVLSRNPKGGK